MYEVIRFKGKVSCIQRVSDGACIPLSTDNRDYVDFLKWQNQQPEESKLNLEDQEPPKKKYDEARREAYQSLGITTEELIVALWESSVEGRPEKMQQLQNLREEVKNQFPKE